jgi:nicotinate-nucleotide adenylyltransferase
MGADSFAHLHLWNDWTDIPETIPLAILARPGFSMRALESPAALRYENRRIASDKARELPGSPPPAWCFIPMPLRGESSTAIREKTRNKGLPRKRPVMTAS